MRFKDFKEFINKCNPVCDDLDVKFYISEEDGISICPAEVKNFVIKTDMVTHDKFFSIDVDLNDW